MTDTELVVESVIEERKRQNHLWGEQNHSPYVWLTILGEEVGEANNAVLEEDLNNFRNELIQVAAVAVAMVESLDRNELSESKHKDKEKDAD